MGLKNQVKFALLVFFLRACLLKLQCAELSGPPCRQLLVQTRNNKTCSASVWPVLLVTQMLVL